MNLGEHDLRATRTNIYPHSRQETIILLPKRIILQRSLIEVIIVIVVIVMTRNVDVLIEYPVVVVCQSVRWPLIFRAFIAWLRQRCSPP